MNFSYNNFYQNPAIRYKTLKPQGELDNAPIEKGTPSENAKQLQNDLVRPEPVYDMQGIEPARGEVSGLKSLEPAPADYNYSTPVGTYLPKSEAEEKFTPDELEKYFILSSAIKSNGDRQDIFRAYVLKPNLEINGQKIITVDQLYNILHGKSATNTEDSSTPVGTYLPKSEAEEKFTPDELKTYFILSSATEVKNGNFGIFRAYVLKHNLEINGQKIITVDQLLDVLHRESAINPEAKEGFTSNEFVSYKNTTDSRLLNTFKKDGIQDNGGRIDNTIDKTKFSKLSFKTFTLQDLLNAGLTQSEIDKFFLRLDGSGESKVTTIGYIINNSLFEGKTISSLEELVQLIKQKSEEEVNAIVSEIYDKYMNFEIEFEDIETELLKLGVEDISYEALENDAAKRCRLNFRLNGITTSILSNRSEAEVVTTINKDGSTTSTVESENVTKTMNSLPENDKYASKAVLRCIYNFSLSEIDKYFDLTLINKHGGFTTFVLKDGITINGLKITTIDELKDALDKA